MGRIQSSVGLISGVPIADTVDKLIALAARPRDLLEARNKDLKAKQVALGELTALTIAIEISTGRLGKPELFDQLKADSSRPELLSASVTGTPTAGNYTFTPLQRATHHQLVSNGVADPTQSLGTTGSLTFRFGGYVDEPLKLEQLNGGAGVQRGKIRVTDRSGGSAVVDLSRAIDARDVVEAINSSDGINVQARLVGDRIELNDLTGQSVSNLIVSEVNGGRTAADLGLAGINVAASTASGQDIVSLHTDLAIGELNDGNGISFQNALPDIEVTVADGTKLSVDFQQSGSEEQTLGDLLDTINAVDPSKLQARISSSGDAIELVDLTSGGGTLQVTSINGSQVAEDLGLTGTATAGVLTGKRILGGLGTTLLSSLQGGRGLGTLGQLSLTDRSGASASVDLSTAQTLDDVVESINAAGVAITAQLNDARNGIELIDTSGATASNLIVANGDATNTADALGLAVDAAQERVNSGELHRQTVSERTLLSDLNFGNGVALGSILITDSAGQSSGVNLATSEAKTLGDVIDLINGLGIGVTAKINDNGDGLVVEDTALGGGVLTITDTGSGTSAKDLGIAGTATSVLKNGKSVQVLEGSETVQVDIQSGDSLEDIVDKINDAGANVAASVLHDGSSYTPYRLSLFSERSGKDGAILVDSSGSPFSFQVLSEAEDAIVALGVGSNILATSSKNEFTELVDGLSLQVGQPTGEAVTVSVSADSDAIVRNVNQFVDSYNKVADKIAELTFYNEADQSTGILFGSHETLRLETDLSRLVTGRFAVDGDIRSLGAVGITTRDDGTLDFDEEKFQAAYAEHPEDVKALFSEDENGFSARFKQVLDSLSGEENSLLINGNDSLQRQIESNLERIDLMTARLDSQREQLYAQFLRMEQAIAKFQSSSTALQQIRALPALTASK